MILDHDLYKYDGISGGQLGVMFHTKDAGDEYTLGVNTPYIQVASGSLSSAGTFGNIPENFYYFGVPWSSGNVPNATP